ncbi:MAG: DUF4393 domain-containing protein [Ferrovibrio sp.]|uniref:Abi-alpha family protein n=1 Tax=Ferrovibrio sp. TaxID=1917215 RepID=UPI00260E25A6|nr:Abi-alpha family protein [Ferrovibrio sp.]MCW0233202.1 DUF4393 domain-containing protein [Ferrovibrio sp.]
MGKRSEVLSKEEAEAVSAVAKTSDRAIEALQQFGGFLGKVFGTVPEDTIGLFGDYLRHLRIRNFSRMQQRTEEILAGRPNVEIEAVSPTIAIPLLSAAQDESRPELQELWARLLANAMDKNAPTIRQSYIDALKKFDPADAVVLKTLHSRSNLSMKPEEMNNLSAAISLAPDEITVSLDRLVDLGCAHKHQAGYLTYYLLPFGRLLLNACA